MIVIEMYDKDGNETTSEIEALSSFGITADSEYGNKYNVYGVKISTETPIYICTCDDYNTAVEMVRMLYSFRANSMLGDDQNVTFVDVDVFKKKMADGLSYNDDDDYDYESDHGPVDKEVVVADNLWSGGLKKVLCGAVLLILIIFIVVVAGMSP